VAQIFRCTTSADERLDVYDGTVDSRIGVTDAGLADLSMALSCASAQAKA
jgi:hypothetical protein